jgi:STE24 endopeptidase
MVIEEKYGFNKSTVKTFVFDRIRGLILSVALGLFLGFLMMLLHTWLGDYLIILFATVMFIFSLVISFLAPYLVRIGNKFTSLEDGELRTKLMELLTSHGYKVRDIKVMDASRRTTKLNAYFTGVGSTKTIVLFDNLVNVMSTEEICAVFAHELGHGLNKDITKMQILNIGNLLLMAVAVWVSVGNLSLHEAFGFGEINYGFAYILTGLFISLIQPLTAIVTNAYSRRCEYRADKQAVVEGYGEAMIGALKKLARENFAELAPTRISVLLEYSHPPLADRISTVESLIKKEK